MKKIMLYSLLGASIILGACGKQPDKIQTTQAEKASMQATETAVQTTETDVQTENVKQEADLGVFRLLSGTWQLDYEKTNAGLKEFDSLQEMFGTGLDSGNSLKINEQGKLEYYIGVGVGGTGHCEVGEDVVTVAITPYQDLSDSDEVLTLHLEHDDEKEYLAVEYHGEYLYWSRQNTD